MKTNKKFKIALSLLLFTFMFLLVACNKETSKTKYNVAYQQNDLYSITDVNGDPITNPQKVESGTTISFKIVPGSMTSITKVMANETTLSLIDGIYEFIVTENITIYITANEVDNTVSKLEISQKPIKTIYNVGDTFDKSGMVVTAVFLDGTSKEVSNYSILYSNGNNLSITDTKVSVSYTDGFNRNVKTEVNVLVLKELNVSGTLTISEYAESTTLNSIEGLEVKAIFSDNSEKILSIDDLTIFYQNENASSFIEDDEKVTIGYGNLTYEITGINVHSFQAYSHLEAELDLVEDVPALIITGTLVDATRATGQIGDTLAEEDSTMDGNEFNIIIPLGTPMSQGEENRLYDIRVYYNENDFVEITSISSKNSISFEGKTYKLEYWNSEKTVISFSLID